MKFQINYPITLNNRRLFSTKLLCSVVLVAFLTIGSCYSQFYYQGRGPMSLKWEQIKSPKYKLLYPTAYRSTALGLASFLDSIQPYINYNMPSKLVRTPIILRTESVLSNGYVVWAPKRDEMVTTPPADNFSVPWLKQLSVHEWRHVVQMSNMKYGLTRICTWLLGEAGVGIGLLAVSDWLLEGDATLAETQFSEYGRGKQPAFTLEYRGMAYDNNLLDLKLDKITCGSYKDMIPDVYKYGYQMTTAGETFIEPEIWGKIFKYSAKWPILFVPDFFYLRKHHKTSIKELTHTMFNDLSNHWQPSFTPNNYHTIQPKERTYTRFHYPMLNPMDSSKNEILIFKSSFDTPTKLIRLNTSDNDHHHLAFTGSINSRPTIQDSVMYWTQAKYHPIWEQSSYSVIRAMDLSTNKIRTINRWGRNYFVTPLNHKGFAYASLNPSAPGHNIIISDNNFRTLQTYTFPVTTQILGMAYDSNHNLLYYIGLNDKGSYIGCEKLKTNHDQTLNIDTLSSTKIVRPASLSSLSDLTYSDGHLYFGSIASGKDEIHKIDLSTNTEYQITNSTLGAFNPSIADSSIYITTYTPEGYFPAVVSTSEMVDTVKWARLPKNTLNPKRYEWDVPKVENLSITPNAPTKHEQKRYRKASHWFNFNSWAPAGFDADYIETETNLVLTFGATAFFQSTLSDMRGFLTYGRLNNTNWFKGRINYTGLPVQISLMSEYGGGNQLAYGYQQPSPDNPNPEHTDPLKPRYSATLGLSLPLNLSSGGWSKYLTTNFNWAYSNSRLYYSEEDYSESLNRYQVSISWSQARKTAYQNLRPRYGYGVRFSFLTGLEHHFSENYSLLIRGYLPGILRNHSLMLSSGLSIQNRARFLSTHRPLVPIGVINNYASLRYMSYSIDYALPICYPDWGWDGILYFKRIWANLFGGYSTGIYPTQGGSQTTLNHYSYGIDLNVNFNLFRAFEQNVTFTFAKPSTHKGLWFSFGFKMNI